MTALSIITVALYCAIIITTTIIVTLSSGLRRTRSYRALIVLMLGQGLIGVSALAVYAFDQIELKIAFSRLRYLGMSLLGPCVLIYFASLFMRWRWLEKKWVMVLLFTPTAITWTISIVPGWRDLLVTDFKPVTVGILNVVEFRNGPWMPWHLTQAYASSCAMMIFAGLTYRPARGVQRRQIVAVWGGCAVVVIVDVVCVIADGSLRWMMLAGGTFVAVDIAILYVSLKNRLFEIIPYATEKIFRSVSDPIIVIDGEGDIETANAAALEMLELDHTSFGQPLTKLSTKRLEDGAEIEIKGHHFDVVHEAIVDAGKTLQGQIIYLRKVTSRKEIEKNLSDRLELKSVFLSLISHDAASNMQAQSSLLRSLQAADGDAGKSKNAVGMLADSHESLLDFLRNILSWEKSLNRSVVVTRIAFNVRIFAAACCESVGILAAVRGVKITLNVDDSAGIEVKADSEILAVALRNILSNAVRASPVGGTVDLRIVTAHDALHIEVSDHGVGMSAERQRQVLEASLAMDSLPPSANGGFGVGLVLVRYFVNLHGGDFSLTSTPGAGTRASLTVPL